LAYRTPTKATLSNRPCRNSEQQADGSSAAGPVGPISVLGRIPGSEHILAVRRNHDLVALLHRPVFITFVLIGLALATRRLGLPESPEYATIGILRTIAIFIWYSFLGSVVELMLAALRRGAARKHVPLSMLPLLNTVIKVVLLALAIYFFFLAWNINVTAWIASAGIVGLALSFAAKDTLSNLFAGVSIVADAPYKTGDYIILESGERGMVSHIGLRSTRILTRDDVEITVPNGIIGNSKIINEAGGPSAKHRIRIAVGVAYGSDIDPAPTRKSAEYRSRGCGFAHLASRAWISSSCAGLRSLWIVGGWYMNSIAPSTRRLPEKIFPYRFRNGIYTCDRCRRRTDT